ncbi:MAG: hypothetical protein ABIP48_04905 [Planctomycetota bacterium]
MKTVCSFLVKFAGSIVAVLSCYDRLIFKGYLPELASFAWKGQWVETRHGLDVVKGAVYKTTNGGRHWQKIWEGDNLARYVLINPLNPDVIYVSTGIFDRQAANSYSDPPGGVGILKSYDGGQSWQTVNNGLANLYVGSLFMHPQNPDILLAGVGCNLLRQGAGVFLTEDGGQTWQKTLGDVDVDVITSVEFSTKDPDIAYACSAHAIYRSEDGGHRWQRVTPNETSWGPPGVRGGFPIDFQVDPRDSNRIFANAYGGGAFVSNDGGYTWKDASKGYTGAQIRRLAIDPHNPRRVFAAGRSGLFATSDGGENWKGLLDPPAVEGDWNAIAVDPSNPQHILAGSNSAAKLCESFDGGHTWQIVHPPRIPMMGWRAIAFAPSRPSRVYAGTEGNGVYRLDLQGR